MRSAAVPFALSLSPLWVRRFTQHAVFRYDTRLVSLIMMARYEARAARPAWTPAADSGVWFLKGGMHPFTTRCYLPVGADLQPLRIVVLAGVLLRWLCGSG